MATYVIGDIHGCFEEFQRLLEEIEFDPASDRLWHTGDLVNGGPRSLEVVRWFVEHDRVATTVLGNHDLHLLAVAYGVKKKRSVDNFDDILRASDCQELMDWLRHRPLLVHSESWVLVHAGLLPGWTLQAAKERARDVEELLRSSKPEQLLEVMYGNRPRRPEDVTSVEDRWRLTINTMTRMRVLTDDGKLEFQFKSTYEEIPDDRMAWFDVDDPAWQSARIICGHWSALGFRNMDHVVTLDTGCRWGNRLTAFRLEDEALFSVESG